MLVFRTQASVYRELLWSEVSQQENLPSSKLSSDLTSSPEEMEYVRDVPSNFV